MDCGYRSCFGSMGIERISRTSQTWRTAGCTGRQGRCGVDWAKNATEGIAAPARIVPVSVVLVLGQVLPFLGLLFFVLWSPLIAILVRSLGMDFHITRPYLFLFLCGSIVIAGITGWSVSSSPQSALKQDWRSALLHPLGIVLLLGVQWYALVRKLSGRTVSWRNRAYAEQ